MSELSKPRIVCAANRNSYSGEIAIGVRHFCPIMHENVMLRCKVLGKDPMDTKDEHAMAWRTSEQGFIDQHGKFYNRQEAWKIAEENGQILRSCGGDSAYDGTLYSENLY